MVLATNSFFLCDTVLSINSAFTESIKIAGKQITSKEINFKGFNEIVINLEEHMEKDNISLDRDYKRLHIFWCNNISN
ncbi:MAG: hypothetical protein PHR25_00485 [Clostridia bacterium]|nr:hypothetical protein [Clostridia bacterium]MDD4375250.1 hypothetical protein [Clostridia bacterium]